MYSFTILYFVQRDAAAMEESATRTPQRETQLVILRLLSVLMSRSKAGTKPTSSEVRSIAVCIYMFVC